MRAMDVMTTNVITVGPRNLGAGLSDAAFRTRHQRVPVVDRTTAWRRRDRGDLLHRAETGTGGEPSGAACGARRVRDRSEAGSRLCHIARPDRKGNHDP